jgi:benzoate 4-monooxygenase
VLGATDTPVTTYEQVKHLPYLQAVINEGLRLHSTASMGLPRILPPGGGQVMIRDRAYHEGSVVSVPTYSIHREEKTWGDDANVFRPERWLEGNTSNLLKAFNPFSMGPR